MAKYEVYAEYKDSGVKWLGEIPSDWKITALKRYCTVKGGYAFASDIFSSVGEPVIRIGDIKADGSISLENCKFIPAQLAKSSHPYLVEKGQLLMAMTGATIGKAGVYVDDNPAYLNQRVGKFVIDSNGLNYNFLWYTLKTNGYQEYIKLTAFGGAQPNISDAGMVDYISCFPSLVEQTQIANFLDYETAKIDSLISKQEKLIELLKEKRQAVISHAVTKGLNPNVPMKDSGVEWLGEVPEHWSIWKFSHIAPIITCGVASTPTYVEEDEGMPFLSAQNIKNNKLSLHKFNYIPYSLHEQLTRYRKPERGDILVTRVGAGIGEACIVDIDLEFSVYVSLTHIRVNQNIANNKFIMYFFGTDYCKFLNHEGTVTGGGVGNLNVNNVVKYKIGLPSLEEQQTIVDHIDNYIHQQDELILKAESAIHLMQERRTALISAAVTGKIDVRNWQNPNNNNEAKTEFSA